LESWFLQQQVLRLKEWGRTSEKDPSYPARRDRGTNYYLVERPMRPRGISTYLERGETEKAEREGGRRLKREIRVNHTARGLVDHRERGEIVIHFSEKEERQPRLSCKKKECEGDNILRKVSREGLVIKRGRTSLFE